MHYFIALSVAILLAACGSNTTSNNQSESVSSEATIRTTQTFTDTTAQAVINNRGAYVSSQCYTKTKEASGAVHNPCFTCHINSKEPNYIDDADLQESYAMSEYTRINRFTNLFKDRSDAVAAINDESILSYVRQDNYKDANNTLTLAKVLKNVPELWDVNKDGNWNGYLPDCYFNFDTQGFDNAPDGTPTGWRAFAYYPFLGTFWPTNGSTDDVLIRLPESMRQNEQGVYDVAIYKLNLAIVESLIKQSDIGIEATDEKSYGVDLNQNGTLDTATSVVFRWSAPTYDYASKTYSNYSMHYVGKAKNAQIDNTLHMAPGLYPEGTEFLHSVRYIDVKNNKNIVMAPRMKELRYGRKSNWNNYAQLSNASKSEIMEKDLFPDRLRTITGNAEQGLNTGLGWVYQGFIEDKDGFLRPQTYEETLACIGCHSGIGAIVDSTFVFPRKFDHTAKQMGWYHWTQSESGFKNIKEPRLDDGRYEFTLYLEQNHAGDEFRSNDAIMARFINADGTLKTDAINTLHNDVSYLIIPDAARALTLNKAYKVIVDEQSYIYGRDAHVKPVENVYKSVEIDQSSGIKALSMERYPLQ